MINTTQTNTQVNQQLLSYIERIERLTEEKKAIADDIKEVYSEADSNGYDKKAIRKVVKIRSMSTATVQEENSILDTYLSAIGYTLS